ncbi:MAG TPA: ABC transporter permease [Polyangiaceae bacterium]
MAATGLAMLFHDRLKLAGTLAGVVFAVVLASQQGGLFLAVLSRNLILVRHTDADVWILQTGAHTVDPAEPISERALLAARAEPEVAWAAPLLMGGARLQLPDGGSEAVVLVGVELPELRGGPFNVVAGETIALGQPDAVFFEDADREKFGGLNLGDVLELNEHRAVVAGFTWGLVPVGPNSYAFTRFDTAREVLHVENHLVSQVFLKVDARASAAEVAARLRRKLPQYQVRTREEMERDTIRYVLFRTPVGATLLMSTAFALIVGFVTVALTMFTSVADKLREFGTLKALGARDSDLARLLLAQAFIVAIVGTLIGGAIASLLLRWLRTPKLAVHLPPWMMLSTLVLMLVVCLLASALALWKLRKVEPGMVFR